MMIDALLNNADYVVAKKILDAAVARHDAISSNLANVETPGYKRLDLVPSFADSSQQANASRDPAGIAAVQLILMEDRSASAHGQDGNAVRLESELAGFEPECRRRRPLLLRTEPL